MPTTTVSIGYRPIRIGFLIKDNSLEDFLKCCKVNTLLWGGILNPIIPVGDNPAIAQDLIDSFAVDLLLPFSTGKEIENLIAKNMHLAERSRISKDVFYEDWRTKKKIPSYVDILHLIDHFWEKDFKHSKDDRSRCRWFTWDEKDPLANLFTVIFGQYPVEVGLKDNYEDAFRNGLRAKELRIEASLDPDWAQKISPIKFTQSRLDNYRERDGGVFIGDGQNLFDLVLFWNLRASGVNVAFLPEKHFDRFKDYIQRYLSDLDDQPSRNPNFEDWINIYSSGNSHPAVEGLKDKFVTRKKLVLCRLCDPRTHFFNLGSGHSEFKAMSVTAFVEKADECPSIDIPIPSSSPFSEDRLYNQAYALLCGFSNDYAYPGHTLKLPYLPDLNEFYGRQSLVIDPFKLRIQHDGTIALLEHGGHASQRFNPIPIADIMLKILERAGMHVEHSQAGRITNLIINRMGGIDSCRVFKVRGVRKLLKELSEGKSFTEAKRIIFEDNFEKFHDLYIESRKKKNLTADDVLRHLLRKNVLKIEPIWWYSVLTKVIRKEKEFSCENCGYKSRISVTRFNDFWECPFCDHSHFLPVILSRQLVHDRKMWLVKKTGLFSKDNNQEGSIPVLLTLMMLNTTLGHGIESKWCTSLNLKVKGVPCEIDFALLDLGPRFDGQDLSIAIGECKESDEITDDMIQKLCLVKEAIEASGIKCYLIFSKTSSGFSDAEKERFKKLMGEAKRRIVPILFSNCELEPYNAYWFHPKKDTLPYQYPHNFSEMAANSVHMYLS